jgi:hypothetical protein
MYECIDSNYQLYSIKEYCLLKKDNKQPQPIYCPFCNNKASIRGENSKEKTHFMHTPTCSTKNYKNLFASKGLKKSKSEVFSLKLNILSFSYNIFNQIQNTFNIVISPQEFINILDKLVKKKVLELVGVTPATIPYVWVNELGRYKNKLFLYTNSNNKEITKLWNISPNSQKDIILCFNKNSTNTITRSVIPVDTSFLNNASTHIPTSFIKAIVPKVFNALNINESFHDILVKDLLSNV